MTLRFLSSFFALITLTFAQHAFAAQFNNPKYNGFDLDWCAEFAVNCGQPAANLFCQKMGYAQSQGFQIQPHVSVETMTIGQNSICSPSVHECDTFAYINCQPKTQVFGNPSYNGFRLDWCAEFAVNCGQPAAQAYCQKAGYTQAVAFVFQPHLSVETMTVDSNAVCDPQFHECDSFSSITCQK